MASDARSEVDRRQVLPLVACDFAAEFLLGKREVTKPARKLLRGPYAGEVRPDPDMGLPDATEPSLQGGLGAGGSPVPNPSFEELFQSARAIAVEFAARRAGRDVAEDVAQEVGMALWAEYGKGQRPLHDAGYLLRWTVRATKHRMLNRLVEGRARAERQFVFAEEDEARVNHMMAPNVAFAGAELSGAIGQWLRHLTEGERDVVMLVHDDGLTYAEAAAKRGCAPETIRKLLVRANKKLRARAAAWAERPSDSHQQGGSDARG